MPQLNKTLGNEGGGKLVLKTALRIYQPLFGNPMNTNFIENFRATMVNHGLIPPSHIELGKMHRFPTNGRRSDSGGWCRLYLDGRAGVFGDFRLGLTCHWSDRDTRPPTLALRQQRAVELKKAQAEAANVQAIQWARADAANTTIWSQAIPISADDPVARYLAGRNLHLESWPSALRYHLGLEYWQDGNYLGRFPAMLGEVTDAHGKQISLHRTYLTHDGQKAPVDVVKKLTAASSRLSGACIRLGESKVIKDKLIRGVAEGIETALACMAASGTPTVSAVSAQGMLQLKLPDGVERLLIYADNDLNGVGQQAASFLTRRARKAGLAVKVWTPPDIGTDWADVWAAQAKGAK